MNYEKTMEKWYESATERQNINGKQGKDIESGDPQKDFKISRKILVPFTDETDNLNLRRNSTSDRTDKSLDLADFWRFQRVSPFSWGILPFPRKSPQMGRESESLSWVSPVSPEKGLISPCFQRTLSCWGLCSSGGWEPLRGGGFGLRRTDSPVFPSVLSMTEIKTIQTI